VPSIPRPSTSAPRLARRETLPACDWERRHRRLVVLLWAHVAALPLLSVLLGSAGSPLHVAGHAAPAALCALLACAPLPRRARALTAAAGLLTCSATLVHVAPAVTEAHFHFFVVMALLCLYEDAALYGVALLYVVVHHVGVGLLAPGEVFADGRDVVVWSLVHAGAILAASVVNVGVVQLNQDLRERSARAERRLRRVLAVAAEGVIELDAAGRVRFANPAAGAILGCAPERLEGRAAHEIFPQGAFGETFAVRAGGGVVEVECAAGGHARPGDEDGALIVTFHDITRRRRAERDAEVQFAATEVLAASAGLDDAGPALLGVLGEELGWDVGVLWRADHDGTLRRQALRLAHPGLARRAEHVCAAVEQGDGSLAGEALRAGEALWLGDLDGGELAERLQVAEGVALPLHADGAALGVLEFFSTAPRPVDAAERRLVGQVASQLAGFMDRVRRAERAVLLERAALSDALTGLPNRRALDQRLPLALADAARAGEPMCVALLDLDHFKAFNDTHGHPQGDALLREVAVAWSSELREGDVLARYGGEEFALLLPGCSEADARAVAERLLAATPRGQTTSVGVASSAGRADAAAVLAAADEALYAAKRAGRARVHVAPERRFQRRLAAVEGLRAA
jgi:diguanylate cyclase (GGDEF)-like protein